MNKESCEQNAKLVFDAGRGDFPRGVQAPTAVGGWVRSLKLCEVRPPLRTALRTLIRPSSSFLLLLPPPHFCFLYSTPVYCENVCVSVNERVLEMDLSK